MQIGRMLAKLEEMGQLDNTVIVFTGDNGFFLGERGWAGKWYMHEESIRTPMIISDPRLPETAGTTRDEMTLNIDVSPTILSAAGLDIPESVNGRDLMPLAKGQQPAWRQEWFYEHLFEHPRVPKSEGVRSGDLKYFVYPEAEPVYEEMYNVAADKQELTNLVGSAEHAATLETMRAKREEWIENLSAWRIEQPWTEPEYKPV